MVSTVRVLSDAEAIAIRAVPFTCAVEAARRAMNKEHAAGALVALPLNVRQPTEREASISV